MVHQSGSLHGISFVVRLWLEQREVVDGPEWRFQVRHVQSGDEIHCRHLADLLAFVERHAGVPGPHLSPASHHPDYANEEV